MNGLNWPFLMWTHIAMELCCRDSLDSHYAPLQTLTVFFQSYLIPIIITRCSTITDVSSFYTPDLHGNYFYISSSHFLALVDLREKVYMSTTQVLFHRRKREQAHVPSFKYSRYVLSIYIQSLASLETKEHISRSSSLNEYAHTVLLLWDGKREKKERYSHGR